MRKKQLFQILDTSTGKPIKDLFFADKMLAKARRRELNEDEAENNKLRYVVTPGPDHHKFNNARS